ncbi:MAG: PAS domain S-box protein [Desulfatibacillaceae bacterium]
MLDEGNREQRIRELVKQLRETEQAIQEACDGQADAVLEASEGGFTLLHGAQESLVEEMGYRKLAGILLSVQDGIATTDLSGGIVYWNEGATEIFGHSVDEALGKPLEEVLFSGRDAPWNFHALLSGGEHESEIRVRNRDGETIWVGIRAMGRRDLRGEIAGVIVVARDVTERKRTMRALRQSEERLKALSAKLLEAQEEERRRLALYLHDSVASGLTAVKYGLEHQIAMMRDGGTPDVGGMERVVSMVRMTMDDVRAVMTDLRPATLDDLGLISALKSYLRNLDGPEHGMETARRFEVEEADIPEQLKIVIYRIVQEAVNNIKKHSEATVARVDLRRLGNRLRLEIEDNGKGFDMNTTLGDKTPGMGLASIEERISLSGGRLTIRSAPGQGTNILAIWPLE